jgi:ectoine hydroxylase-related dioxygenase (phytanoyl-CoA dioxygenase family)
MLDLEQLRRDGYALLRGAVPTDWLQPLREAFEQGVRPPEAWPVPRGHDWRHSLLDLEPIVQATCRIPIVLQAAGALIGSRFFIAQVEGREPRPGGGHQGLHRDLSEQRPGDTVSALVFLDDYGPANGATRLVPASHRPDPSKMDAFDESQTLQLSGTAGDALVFDADLLHAARRNHSGAPRRVLLIGYFAEQRHATHVLTAGLRGVRMATDERFDP